MATGSYTYTLRLKDLMSKGFAKAGQSSSSFFKGVNRGSKSVNNSFRKIPKSINQLETHLTRLKNKQANSFSPRRIIQYNKQIRKTERSLQKLKNLLYSLLLLS